MKLSTLLSPFTRQSIPDCDITGLHNDSRQIKPGHLFIAYPGAAADGRLYIEKAIANGASAVIYDPDNLPASGMAQSLNIPYIALPEAGKKLAALASRFYGHPSRHLSITGITGTNGKTTIAYLLAQAFDKLGMGAAYIGTLGEGKTDELRPLANTTPDGLCLQRLLDAYRAADMQHVCMEVSSHALSLNRVGSVAFTQAIYTNLSHEHLDFHHTMQAYANEKAKLFAMPDLNHAIINQDDDYSELMIKSLPAQCKKITYGMNPGCDVYATNCKLSMTGSTFEVASPWGTYPVEITTLGLFNVYNSLAVFASLVAHGIPVADVVSVMPVITAAPGRMEVVAADPCVIVDYAHTPDALEHVLQELNKLKQGRIITVFGCGGDRDKTKRPMMGRAAGQLSDLVILTSDNPRTEEPERIIDEIAGGMAQDLPTIKIVLREEAIRKAISLAAPDDIILIAGKGHESYQQIGHERLNFSDKSIVNAIRSAVTSQ